MKKIIFILAILSITISQSSYSMLSQEPMEIEQDTTETQSDAWAAISPDFDMSVEKFKYAVYDHIRGILSYEEDEEESIDPRIEKKYMIEIEKKCKRFKKMLPKIKVSKKRSAPKSRLQPTPEEHTPSQSYMLKVISNFISEIIF